MPDILISQNPRVSATQDPSAEVDISQDVLLVVTRDPSAEIAFSQAAEVLATKAPAEIVLSQVLRVVVTSDSFVGSQRNAARSLVMT